MAYRKTRKIGYARVISRDQDLSPQLTALQAAGCDKIYTETESSVSPRTDQLDAAIAELGELDSFVVLKLNRIGRSLKFVNKTVQAVRAANAHLVSIEDSIDTSTTLGYSAFKLIETMSQLEQDIISENTKTGIRLRIQSGQKFGGRKPVLNEKNLARAKRLIKEGHTIREIGEYLQCSPKTLYRYIPASTFDEIRYGN